MVMSAGRRRRIRADHDCEWRDEAERLRGQVDELKTAVEQIRVEMESMKRRLLGPKSEKIKPIGHEVRDKVASIRPPRRKLGSPTPSCARPGSSPSASSTR